MKYQRSKVGAVRFRRVRLLLLVVVCTFLGSITTYSIAWVASDQLPAAASPVQQISFLPREGRSTADGFRHRNWGAVWAGGSFFNKARLELGSAGGIDFFQRLREADLSAVTAEQQLVCTTPEEWWLGVRHRLDPGINDWSFCEMCEKILSAKEIYVDGLNHGNEQIDIAIAGWPMQSLRLISIDRMSGVVSDPMLPKSGTLLGVSWNFKNDFPIKPIWRGFLVNTALYTLAWFVAIKGISLAIREYQRLHRLRRGLCVNCRYDLKGTPVDVPCPECGATHEGSASKMKNAPIARGD